MKTQELQKLLKKNGSHFVEHGSRHDKWESDITGKQFYIPRHKAEIPTGTLKNIMKDAGLQ